MKQNKKDTVREYIKKHSYFSLRQIIGDTGFDKKTVQNYLYQLKQEKLVFEAGRQIYSSIGRVFNLVKESRVETLLKYLKKDFPFTNYLIWSTRQLQPLYHHTQQHHITFIEAEKESQNPIFEVVSQKYRDTIIEKRNKVYFKEIDLSRDLVIIRKLISRSVKNTHIPPIEKILVDMFIDLGKYKYISVGDYWALWKKICSDYRINMGYIYNYSTRRKCFSAIFTQLIDIYSSYGIDLRHLIKDSGKIL